MLDRLGWHNVCFQEEIPQIPHNELADLEVIDQGGFGIVYRAKHPRFNTVVYKELNVQKLGERYSIVALRGLTTLYTMYNKSMLDLVWYVWYKIWFNILECQLYEWK